MTVNSAEILGYSHLLGNATVGKSSSRGSCSFSESATWAFLAAAARVPASAAHLHSVKVFKGSLGSIKCGFSGLGGDANGLLTFH